MKKFSAKFKSVLLIAASLVTVLLYQNCAKPVAQSSYVVSGLTEQDISQQKAVGVLNTRCARCHNPESPAAGIDVTNVDLMLAMGHVVPTEPNLSPLFNSIQQGQMPPSGGITQEEITDIADWIAGMRNDTPVNLPPGTVPLPLAANFASIKQNIIDRRCLGCHNSTNARGGVSYSTYAATVNTVQRGVPASSAFYTSVATRNTMPQGAPGSLSQDEKRVIFDWILNGALNN